MSDCEPIHLTAYTNARWYDEPFQFFLGSRAQQDNFVGASAWLALVPVLGGDPIATLSTENGWLTFTSPNEFGITVPAEEMSGIPAGDYVWDLLVAMPDQDPDNVLQGTATIIEGITPPPGS